MPKLDYIEATIAATQEFYNAVKNNDIGKILDLLDQKKQNEIEFDIDGKVFDPLFLKDKETEFTFPLWIAARMGHVEALEILLENGAYIEQVDNANGTALHAAAHGGQPKTIEKLIERGANVNAIHAGGNTPFHFAVLSGNLDAVSVFLSNPNIDIGILNYENKSVIDLALELKRNDILKQIADAGIQVVKKLAEEKQELLRELQESSFNPPSYAEAIAKNSTIYSSPEILTSYDLDDSNSKNQEVTTTKSSTPTLTKGAI